MLVILAGSAVSLAAVVYAVWVYRIDNVEQASYQVSIVDADFEVRDYPQQVVAEVMATGDRKAAANGGFRTLAEYIFAKERPGAPISMTAPVTQSRDTIAMTAPVTQSSSSDKTGADTWTVRFVMPAKYTLASLPKPSSGRVQLQLLPATRRAAIRFSGVATDGLIAKNEVRLRDWLDKRGLIPLGQPTYAYYNAPFTPGPFRRNEVWLEIAQ